MNDTILVGHADQILRVPRPTWEKHHAQEPEHSQTRLGFMTEAHHRVRNFAVTELPRTGRPIEPEKIAQALQLPLGQVKSILDELEKKLFFLVRNAHEAVCWAYPVTVAPTLHHLSFSSGEKVYAA